MADLHSNYSTIENTNNEKRVQGKVVIVTGAAGGLGSCMALTLAKNGAKIVLLDIDDRAAEIRDMIVTAGGDALYRKTNLTDESDWASAVAEIIKAFGKVDVLINNVGINIRKPIEEMALEEWNTMMLVNTGSVFLGCKSVMPYMKEQGSGSIINTSSVCGLVGHLYTTEAYTATKGAVTMLTKSIASRYASFGIRCNSIHPSTVETALTQQMMQSPEWKQQRIGEVPLGRLAVPQDVANAVLFLASDEASFINGAALTVDGGVTCY